MTIHAETPWQPDDPDTIVKAIAAHVRDVLPWIDEAACRTVDPELFFPGHGASNREGLAVCARCPVRDPCLEQALATGETYGIWGGTTERDRRSIRRKRRARSTT